MPSRILAYHQPRRLGLRAVPGHLASLPASPPPVLAALAGAGIGALSLRTSGVHFIMITLAFAQMIYFLAVSLKIYGGDDGLTDARARRLPAARSRATTRPSIISCLAHPRLSLLRPAIVCRLALRHGAARRRQNERRIVAIGFPDLPLQA